MNHSKMNKLVQLALRNPNENEAAVAAKMFFKKLTGNRFLSTQWGLSGDDARRLMKLGGVQVKGAKPEPAPVYSQTVEEYTEAVSCLIKLMERDGEVRLSPVCLYLRMKPSTARRKLRAVYGTGLRWVFISKDDLMAALKILG